MRFLLSKLRIFLFFPIPYLSQPLFNLLNEKPIIYAYNRKNNYFISCAQSKVGL